MKTYQIQKAVRLWIPLQHGFFPLQKCDGKVQHRCGKRNYAAPD